MLKKCLVSLCSIVHLPESRFALVGLWRYKSVLRRIEKRERGVYEKEPGSDILSIRYKVNGVLHR